MSRRFPRLVCSWCVIATSVLVLALTGCESGDQTPSPSDAAETAAVVQPSPASLAVLAKADAVDGTTDKVISMCLTCNLGMLGSADQVAKVGEYELHLCSAECKAHFDEAPEKALLAVKIPE